MQSNNSELTIQCELCLLLETTNRKCKDGNVEASQKAIAIFLARGNITVDSCTDGKNWLDSEYILFS